MSDEIKSVAFYLSAVAIALGAGAMIISMEAEEITRQKRQEREPMLVADMEKAVAIGQSGIAAGKAHVFWLTEKDQGNFKTLRGEYNAANNNFCWGDSAASGPRDCFPMKEASQDFTLAMMRGACKTAEQKSDKEFHHKYCPRFSV